MTDSTLSALTAVSSVTGTDELYVNQGGSKKATAAQVKAFTLSGLAISDVASLQTALDGKASTSHTHTISNVTGLQTALDGKAATSHTHTASDITDFAESVDDRVSTLLVAGNDITLTYNDGSNTLTIDSTASVGGGSSPTTTLGDIIYRGTSADQRLAIGSDGQVLKVVSGVPAWATDSTISIDNMTATWNNAGTVFSAIKMNVTDVASQYDSYFLDMRVGGSIKFSVTKNGAILSGAGGLTISSAGYGYLGYLGLKMNKDAFIGFASGGTGVNGSTAGPDTTWYRTAAGIMALRGSGTSAGASLELLEQTAPAAGAANTVRIYAVDNGSGKTQLMALFATGAAQQIAIEP